jgi:hypothetical protein
MTKSHGSKWSVIGSDRSPYPLSPSLWIGLPLIARTAGACYDPGFGEHPVHRHQERAP